MDNADFVLYKHLLEKVIRIEEKLDKLLAPKKRKPRTSKAEYPEWFEVMWQIYPKRSGCNPKNKAYSAASARMMEIEYTSAKELIENSEIHQDRMYAGVERYRRYCKATNKINTEYVLQAATFFGPADPPHYENDWTIPKPKEKNGQPEIFSQSHQDADFSGQAEKALDPVDPYAELK